MLLNEQRCDCAANKLRPGEGCGVWEYIRKVYAAVDTRGKLRRDRFSEISSKNL